MNYNNESCAGCSNLLNEDADIVVCPECATPQHRECWNKNNCCVNEKLHASGFVWEPEKIEEPLIDQPAVASVESKPLAGEAFPVFSSTPDEKSFEALLLQGVAADKDEEFDNIKVSDAALYLQNGARRYINKFMKEKDRKIKLSWNWAALFFSPAWFFYRKLYSAGAIFLSLFVALSLFTTNLSDNVYSSYQNVSAAMSQAYKENNSDSALAAEKLLEDEVFSKEYYQLMKNASILFSVTLLAPNVIAALCANALLKKKMRKDIQKAKEEAEEPRFEKMLIIRKGGVSVLLFAVVFMLKPYIPSLLFSVGDWIKNIF